MGNCSTAMAYLLILLGLLIAELVYFKVADHYNIIDKPNERSSHTRIVLRGGGIIFTIALWIWSVFSGFEYPWLLAGVTLATCVSFIDDIHSLPDSFRLLVQFVAMLLVFQDVGLLQRELLLAVPIALFACVGATNIYNFMDGINGITGGYSLAVLVPLFLLNRNLAFVDETYLIVIGLSLLVFCFFNFRTKAKCFAGDVGSIGIALLLIFAICRLIVQTGDITWIILLLLYCVDGSLTIAHRIMLHENLGQAHRKHAFQLMANELHIPHVAVSSIYMLLQLTISLTAIYIIPDNVAAHWAFLVFIGIVLAVAYILFMRKYYHLHEEYLSKVKNDKQ